MEKPGDKRDVHQTIDSREHFSNTVRRRHQPRFMYRRQLSNPRRFGPGVARQTRCGRKTTWRQFDVEYAVEGSPHMETIQVVIDKKLLQATDQAARRTKRNRSALSVMLCGNTSRK